MSCDNCRFTSEQGCAANLLYWEAFRHLGQIHWGDKVKPFLQPCPEQQPPRDLTFTFTLTETEWRLMVERKHLSEKLRAQIAESSSIQPPMSAKSDDIYDPIPF